jgi:type II secretory pathway predicted ATPase ExeA
LWGCDELLRRVFERLGQGGSQALIGPAGCGKSEILRAIGQAEEALQRPVFSLDMHLVRDERSFFDRLCDCLEIEPLDDLSRVPRQIERELKRRKQAHVLCLDEIHVLTDAAFFPLATRNWLKGMADAVYPLQLVVASQKELRELFPDSSIRSSPLADFFAGQTELLGHWDLGKVEAFLRDRLSGTEVEFEPGQIEGIQQKSGGKPKLVRELALDLYHRKVSGGDRL